MREHTVGNTPHPQDSITDEYDVLNPGCEVDINMYYVLYINQVYFESLSIGGVGGCRFSRRSSYKAFLRGAQFSALLLGVIIQECPRVRGYIHPQRVISSLLSGTYLMKCV